MENSIEVSVIVPTTPGYSSLLNRTVQELVSHFRKTHAHQFEIVVVTNGKASKALESLHAEVRSLANTHPEIRTAHVTGKPGKGAALQLGFANSSGRYICFTDADLPYELSFFSRALKQLENGAHLVSGNRRLPESRFDVPVSNLKLAYSRHCLGLLFNRFVRLMLPIETRDTQAGIKAMSRYLAQSTFSNQICGGFHFDLEIFLTAKEENLPIFELPVRLFLENEKSTVRVVKETIGTLYWLWRITFRYWTGGYSPQTHSLRQVGIQVS